MSILILNVIDGRIGKVKQLAKLAIIGDAINKCFEIANSFHLLNNEQFNSLIPMEISELRTNQVIDHHINDLDCEFVTFPIAAVIHPLLSSTQSHCCRK